MKPKRRQQAERKGQGNPQQGERDASGDADERHREQAAEEPSFQAMSGVDHGVPDGRPAIDRQQPNEAIEIATRVCREVDATCSAILHHAILYSTHARPPAQPVSVKFSEGKKRGALSAGCARLDVGRYCDCPKLGGRRGMGLPQASTLAFAVVTVYRSSLAQRNPAPLGLA
jgi:hypothetical protein